MSSRSRVLNGPQGQKVASAIEHMVAAANRATIRKEHARESATRRRPRRDLDAAILGVCGYGRAGARTVKGVVVALGGMWSLFHVRKTLCDLWRAGELERGEIPREQGGAGGRPKHLYWRPHPAGASPSTEG
ncbi:MAG: hypothetical protein KF709_02755 [Gemmatimonadaceae bacterium]|nr:hypothetical protein [Gemmatimonadaceae bacterium]